MRRRFRFTSMFHCRVLHKRKTEKERSTVQKEKIHDFERSLKNQFLTTSKQVYRLKPLHCWTSCLGLGENCIPSHIYRIICRLYLVHQLPNTEMKKRMNRNDLSLPSSHVSTCQSRSPVHVQTPATPPQKLHAPHSIPSQQGYGGNSAVMEEGKNATGGVSTSAHVQMFL